MARELSGRFQVSLVWEGALVGLAAGLVVTLYRLSLMGAERVLRVATGASAGSLPLMLVWIAVVAVALLLVGRLMLWEPATQGSGIPQVDAEIMGKLDMPWARVLPAKFLEGTLCTFAGLSMGREGPSVQLGGVAGKAVSRLLRRRRGEERLLVTCGAASGMAAAFHAPLTGIMFALEELRKTFSAPLIISLMSSCVVADYVCSQALGLEPTLSLLVVEYIPHGWYALVVLLGLLMGVFGATHNLGMFCAQDLFCRIRRHAPYTRLLLPFALSTVCAFLVPQLTCGGDEILELLERPQSLTALGLIALLAGKYLLTTICFGSGAPGGTLFPLVTMGALAGALYGLVAARAFGLDMVLVSNFMLLGIAGLFSAVVRAPVTAVVLVFELTGDLQALLSAAIVSVLAYVTANLLKVDAFYEHLLARLLGTSAEETSKTRRGNDQVLTTFVVEPGSELEGRYLGDVRIPGRALVVTVSRHGQDFVPDADTRLEMSDKVVLLTDAHSSDEAESFMRGACSGKL